LRDTISLVELNPEGPVLSDVERAPVLSTRLLLLAADPRDTVPIRGGEDVLVSLAAEVGRAVQPRAGIAQKGSFAYTQHETADIVLVVLLGVVASLGHHNHRFLTNLPCTSGDTGLGENCILENGLAAGPVAVPDEIAQDPPQSAEMRFVTRLGQQLGMAGAICQLRCDEGQHACLLAAV